jgi:uncharacterized protein
VTLRGLGSKTARPSYRSKSEFIVSASVWAIFLVIVFAAGCKKKENDAALKPGQVHTITREMLRSASALAGGRGKIESRLEFDGVHPDRVDHLRIPLNDAGSEASRHDALARLIQSLDRTATSHSLTRDPNGASGSDIHLYYRRAGVLTHSIEVTAQSSAASFLEQTGSARLAIILDDLGNDRSAAEAIFALGYPVTISVLPNYPHSEEIAHEAHKRGYQVMLHLPMQSVANEKPEPEELRRGMSASDVSALVDELLRAVPDASGVNNHQGSQSTADTALMDELMPVLRERKLFYIDSRTTAATVAYDSAHRLGVRSGFRNVPFLDDVAEPGAVRKQLQLALRGAVRKGEAIAIGHPHPATLQALNELLPQARAEGVRLVFVSDVVH